MGRGLRAISIIALVVAIPRFARAEPPTLEREGFLFAASTGPAGFVGGSGLRGTNGGGAMTTLRVGTAASHRLSWLFELYAGVFGGRIGEVNHHYGQVAVGGQYYARRSLWFRFGLGIGTYAERIEGTAEAQPGSTRKGPAYNVAMGFDLLQRGQLAVYAEIAGTGARFEDAFMTHMGMSIGLAWY